MKNHAAGHDPLAQVENSISAAYDALLNADFSRLESKVLPQLEEAMTVLQALCDCSLEPYGDAKTALGPRLWMLRKQLLLVQAMLRQCAAFGQLAAQNAAPESLTYSPRGLEAAV